MILTCPQCATRYQLKGSEFPASGRSVRCAKCRHIWFQNPPPPDAEADLVATSAPVHGKITASSSGADQQSSATAIGVKYRARGERTAIIACWLAFVAIVALIIWGLVRYREAIMNVWPQAGPIYRAFGVSVNTNGLAFSDVNYRRDTEAGQLVLTVRGNVVNGDNRPAALPEIEVVLTDSHRHRVDSWIFSAGMHRLEPGQRIAFTTHRVNPPEQARHLEMVFARRQP